MSDFSEYEKMPKNFKKLDQSEKALSDLNKLKWVVTEKVHGANFSFVYENRNLSFAKRKEYLKWNDDFFGFQLMVAKMESHVMQFFEDLSLRIKAKKYILYGELFGGKYPHQDVIPDTTIEAIQTGVYYSPSIEFYAFDIAVENESKYYLDFETALSYFEKHRIIHAKPLFIGKLNESLNFNTRINSTIPKQLNLPEIDHNLIEGVVIKPLKGSGKHDIGSRAILKIKNREFDEEKKFHEAEKWSYTPSLSSKTEDLGFIINEMRNYVTGNRLNSVLSKVGSLDLNNKERLQKIEREFLEDIFIDFNENNDNLLNDINNSQREWIISRITSAIHELVLSDGTS